MMIEEQKSLIWNVIAFTLAVIALLFILFCAVLAVFFPKCYGDLLFSVGLKNVSLSAYEYHYQTTNDINDLYLLLCKSISANNDEFVVKSYKKLAKQNDYYDFIEFKEDEFLKNCETLLQKLYLSNEDNYLKGKYVLALKNLEGGDVAFDYAYNELKQTNVTSSSDRANYVLSYYIQSLNDVDDFEYITAEVKDDIYQYYESLYSIYSTEMENSKLSTEIDTKLNLLKLNHRITDIYYSMERIEKFVGMGVNMEVARERASELSHDFINLLN